MAEPLIGKTTLPRLWMYICQLWIIVAVGAIAMVSPEQPSVSEVARRPSGSEAERQRGVLLLLQPINAKMFRKSTLD